MHSWIKVILKQRVYDLVTTPTHMMPFYIDDTVLILHEYNNYYC